ncbi:hypothetical protein Ntsu_70260 [Nocardia sp. IFM 10818]
MRRVDGAQRFVPRHHIGDGAAQGVEIQCAGEADGRGNVVGGRVGVEPVEEPHALLCQRQRRVLRPSLGGEGLAHTGSGVRFHPGGQRRHGRGLEQHAHADLGVQRGRQPRHGLGGDEGVAAEFEEVVVHADAFHAEQVGEDLRGDLLDRGRGRAETLGLEDRCGQRLAIQLAGGIDREGVQDHQGRGHHVRGQRAAQRGLHRVGVHHGVLLADHVAHELIAGVRIVAHHHDRLRDAGLGQQRGLDLAQLDAQTAQLDLEVGAAQVVQLAVGGPGDEVAGAVHARAGRAVRVGDEAVRGQVRAAEIAAGQLIARQIELTRDTRCDGSQPGVQDVGAGVPHRPADRHEHGVGLGDLVVGDVDGGLGGAVQVVQARAGQLAQLLRGRRGQRLTGGEDLPQPRRGQHGVTVLVAQGGHEDRQHGRHEVRGGDAFLGDDLRQIDRITVPVRLGHDQARPGLQGPEELPHRHVEGGRGLLQHRVVRADRVLVLHPQQAVDDRAVLDRDALRAAGRTGGEDHVGGVRWRDRPSAFGIGDRLGRVAVEVDRIHLEHRHIAAGHEVVAAGGEDGRRAGGVQHVVDALCRLVRIQRHIRATGLQHRVHGDHEVERAPDGQRHKRFRSDAVGHELAGQAVHPRRELGVGQTCPLEADGRRIGAGQSLCLEERNQRRRRAFGQRGQDAPKLEVRVVPAREDLGALVADQQIDIADRPLRIGGDRVQDQIQPVRERRDGGLVEKIQGIGELGGHARVLTVRVLGLLQGQLQVELGQARVVVDAVDRESGQFQAGLPGVLEGQHDLEQRVPRLRARRVEHLDEAFERHVGVGEGVQVGIARGGEQFGEGGVIVHLGAQHQGVDEHADEVVERGLTAAVHRGADGDIAGSRQPGQQHRQRGVQHHEQRGIVPAAQIQQALLGLGGDGERVGAAAVAGHGRPLPVPGQHQLVRQIRQTLAPVPDLLGDQRVRIVLGTEHLALPQRVVRVLHRQFGPRRGLPGGAGGVGDHDVAGQRAHGPAVGGDMVHHHAEHVLGLADLEQPGVQRHLAGDVEGHGGQLDQVLDEVGLGDRHRGQIGHDLRGVLNPLHRSVRGLREDGAQRLVPVDDIDDGDLQGRDIELAGQPDGDRDVVDRRGGVEPVEEPHALLRKGKRDIGRTLAGHQRLAAAVADMRFHPRGQRRHGGGLEQHAHRDAGVQGGAEAGGDLGGDERVAAELEEVVVHADARDAEHLAEDLGDDLLDRRCRGAELAHLEARRGQRLAVQLAGGVEREGIQHHEGRGHHVRGQRAVQPGLDAVEVDRAAGHQVGDQLIAGDGVHDQHDRLADRGVVEQGGLDLAELDALAAELHLEVGAADVLHDAGLGLAPAHQVTGAVEAGAGRAEGVGDEAFRAQIGAAVVAARDLRAAQVQLTRDAGGHRAQAAVEDVGLRVPHRPADGHRGDDRLVDGRVGGVHGELGRAVQVVHGRGGELPEGGHGGGRQRLTGDQNRTQRQAFGRRGAGGEDRQHGRHERGHGDPVPADDLGQVQGIAVTVGGGDDHLRADGEGAEQLPHRHIEGDRRLLQDHIGVVDAVFGGDPGDLVEHRRMPDGHALGAAGGAGGVEHVGGVLRAQLAQPLGRGDAGVVELGQVQPIQVQDRAIRALHGIVGGGEQHHRLGAGQHVIGALGRVIGIDRHIAAARRQSGVDGDQHVHRAANADRHQRFRADALGDELARQAVHPAGELGIAEFGGGAEHAAAALARIEDQRGGVRADADLLLEQVQHRHRRGQRARGLVPLGQDGGALALVQDVDIAHHRFRCGDGGFEHAQVAPAEFGDGAGVEQIGGVGQHHRQTVGLAVDAALLGQRPLQVELGDVDLELVRGDGEVGQLHGAVRHLLERQHDLEQRMPRLRTGRVEHLHEALEGHVGIGEGRQIGFPGAGQEVGEAFGPIHFRAQHQGVDEHADQIVEGLLTASGDRGADGDIGGAREPGQQHRERGVHDHEQRNALGPRESGELRVQFGRNVEGDAVAAEALHRRARAIGGQVQLIRQARQRGTPVSDLARGHGAGIGFRAQQFALPDAEVLVLHRQRGPAGLLTRHPRQVGGGHIARERAEREAVRGDVVHHERDGVVDDVAVGRADLEHPHANGQLARDIETARGEFGQGLVQPGLVDGDELDAEVDLVHGQHALEAAVPGLREDGAQRFLPRHHIGERELQRLDVHAPAQPHHEGQVVGRDAGIELIEEPHALLGQR